MAPASGAALHGGYFVHDQGGRVFALEMYAGEVLARLTCHELLHGRAGPTAVWTGSEMIVWAANTH